MVALCLFPLCLDYVLDSESHSTNVSLFLSRWTVTEDLLIQVNKWPMLYWNRFACNFPFGASGSQTIVLIIQKSYFRVMRCVCVCVACLYPNFPVDFKKQFWEHLAKTWSIISDCYKLYSLYQPSIPLKEFWGYKCIQPHFLKTWLLSIKLRLSEFSILFYHVLHPSSVILPLPAILNSFILIAPTLVFRFPEGRRYYSVHLTNYQYQ